MSDKYTLLYPIKLPSGETITAVDVVDRIKGKHLRQILNATKDGDKALSLVSSLTGLDEDIIDEFDTADITALANEAEKKGLK